MPRYFFNVISGETVPDLIGTELPDKNAAWESAVLSSCELVSELDRDLSRGWRMEVTDEFANTLFEIQVKGRAF